MNNDALAKIAMLRGSVRCLVFGLLSLLPGIGLPFAIVALCVGGKVRAHEKLFWNAAKPYRIYGTVCAAVGMIVWGGLLVIIIIPAIVPNYWL